uniref:Pentatricopeptide repeat-containing protein-mitochondrial domain-containing protein n=1 Tax=Ananas comosus var. bracteatus TaxID=296719 RepID=A0A6V7Q7Z7_ANACO|nr:unnamed protein product [Ananas comosus var. bracteatus]
MKGEGFKPRCETFSALIASYSRKGLVSEAVDTFEEMKTLGVEPNEIVFGSLVDIFAENGKVEEALRYYSLMEKAGLVPNQIVITSLIKAYSKVSQWKEAQELYSRMKDMEGGPDVIASNCMINLYANLGMITEAKLILNDLRRNSLADVQKLGAVNDCASYNNIMACYAANGKINASAELLKQMMASHILPDATTFKIIFTLLRKGGIPSEAVSQLEVSYKEGRAYAKSAIVSSLFSVVKMHEDAMESCEEFLSGKFALDSSAYNSAINAYGASGEVEKALNLFMRMQDEGLKPDLVTYIYLAGCYGKAGMVEGLRRVYGLLKYGEIEPNESLYKALIDAYRDAGKNDLAEMVEQEMRFSASTEEIDDSESEGD